MTRRQFLQMSAAAGAAMAMPVRLSAAAAAERRPPNVLFVMVDDADRNHFGCYGNSEVRTPDIDSLAKTGVQFSTCWATPICAPSRALVMTGRYAHRTGVYHNSLWLPRKEGKSYLDVNRTFGDFLQKAGYATAIAGKWQVGRADGAARAGFDEYFLWEPAPTKEFPKGAAFQGAWLNETQASPFWNPCFVRNGELVPTKPDDFGEALCVDFLTDYMRRNRDRPFLAYFTPHLPHGAFTCCWSATPLSGKVGDVRGGSLWENIDYIDVLVGRLLKALDDLRLRENTIVFFTSDNGGGGTGKGEGMEEGCRAPMIVNGPGVVKPRGLTRRLTSLVDVLPTFLGFADAKPPADYPLDGVDISPFLRGRSEATRPWIYSYVGTSRMIRNERWLLEEVDPVYNSPWGRFYDCDGSPYGDKQREVTDSEAPEVLIARKRLDDILATIPDLDYTDPDVQEQLRTYDKYPFPSRLMKAKHAKAARSGAS